MSDCLDSAIKLVSCLFHRVSIFQSQPLVQEVRFLDWCTKASLVPSKASYTLRHWAPPALRTRLKDKLITIKDTLGKSPVQRRPARWARIFCISILHVFMAANSSVHFQTCQKFQLLKIIAFCFDVSFCPSPNVIAFAQTQPSRIKAGLQLGPGSPSCQLTRP